MKSVGSEQLTVDSLKRISVKPLRGFTLIEMLVVIAVIGFLASAILATVTTTQLDAKDKRRIADLKQIENALGLYYTRYNTYPSEESGANGNMSTNVVFQNLMRSYINGTPIDPNNIDDPIHYYYYDGMHQCGTKKYAIIFARQMERASNSNYDEFLNTTCFGVLDGEGRGGGEESYNLIIGSSNG